MTACTFAGHREVYQAKIDERIETAIDDLLQTDSEFTFYTGGMGDFDNKCAWRSLWKMHRKTRNKEPH